MDVVVTSYDGEQHSMRGALARSSSAVSSNPARPHHHHHDPHTSHQHHHLHGTASSASTPSERRRYQYVPYKNTVSSSSQDPVHNGFGSQTSLPSQTTNRMMPHYTGSMQRLPRGQNDTLSMGQQNVPSRGQPSRGQLNVPSRGQQNVPSQNVPSRGQQNVPSSHSQGSSQDQRQHGGHYNGVHHPSMHLQRRQIPDTGPGMREARSNSVKAADRHVVENYVEFSDAYHQFNNRVAPGSYQQRGSSSSSDGSPQSSPLHSYGSTPAPAPHLQPQGHQHSPANYTQHQQRQGRQNYVPNSSDRIQQDLHELRHTTAKQSSMIDRHHHNNSGSPYRSSSRNTYAKSNLLAPRRVNSNESFSLASSIKCCVGFQPKKKASRRVMVHQSSHQMNKQREKLNTVAPENWVSLAAVRSHHDHSPVHSSSQSTVSCPHTVSAAARNAHKHSSGYASEIESQHSSLMEGYSSKYDSDSDFSDSDFARAASGSRGKSASHVMMKLAKKFSKKSLSITREDGDGGSIGSDSYEGSGKMARMKHRSNSVSNLDSLEGLGARSRSMEQLRIDGGRSASLSKSGTPQSSPHMSRSSSKGKLNRRSAEFDSDSAVSSNLFRSGSRRNLLDPAEALFDAIEHGSLEAVQSLLDTRQITKFGTLNEDEFLAVDLCVMLGHQDIAQILLKIGAKDSPKFCRDPLSRLSRVRNLASEAERDLFRLKGDFASQNASSGLKEVERRYKRGERRLNLYRQMLLNYEIADPPGPPTDVELHITSNRSLMVTFSDPHEINNAAVTRYKVEWCKTDEFKPVVGDFVMTDLRCMEYIIPDLDRGERYFVRVSAYNMKGFGPTQISSPPSAVPSSWHDFNNTAPRYQGCTDNIHLVAAQFGLTLQTAPILPTAAAGSGGPSKAKSIRKTNPLSRMFTSNVKFQKLLKPGVYIASLIYSEETKILVTTDENIPIIDVADSTSSSIGSDFVWLAKLACTWEHVQAMCDISDNYISSPAVQFRNKLLHAVLDLQNALGVTDLGLLHPVPYKDAQGAIVFVIIQYVADTKSVASGNSLVKWTELPKLWKKRAVPTRTTGLEAFPVPDQIVLDAQEIIAHHHTSVRPLERGLYLGYLKARSSVASMKVICSREYPNVLPHLKIRDNPNLSTEEWQWIKSLQSPSSAQSSLLLSTNPHLLQHTLLSSVDLFLKNLGFSKEQASQHQLYVHEAIELNENITILLVLPLQDNVCTAPGSSDHFADTPDFVALPINTFEIMQLYTYQRSFMTKFSMVSTRLEVELLTSHQRLREAFSKAEVTEAKEKKTSLENFNARTDQVWKKMRWIEDAVQNGRDYGSGYDTLLPLTRAKECIEEQKKEAMRMKEEAQKKAASTQQQGSADGLPDEGSPKQSGYLRVVPTYRTGLARGTSVKLYIESTTTTLEVISLVVKQVANATAASVEDLDMSDFYLVASGSSRDTKELVLKADYHPLQLQLDPAGMGKVFLSVKRKSEENTLNQMVTSV